MPLYGSSRQRPWPYDAEIDGVGMRLVGSDSGELVATNLKSIEAVPSTFEYGSADPRKEKTKAWANMYFGYGQAVEPDGKPRRVHYNIDVDDSINGLFMLGPKFTSETIVGAGASRGFIQALHGGVLTLFAIAQNGVYRRDGDANWQLSISAATLGSTPLQAIRFKDPSGTDGLMLASSGSNIARYNGTTWTVAAGGAGAPENFASAVTKIRDELWVGWGNKVAKAEANPLLRASYGGPIVVGDASASITWMGAVGDQLIVFKDDGVYTVDELGEPHDLFPSLRLSRSANNGVNAANWLEDLWVPWKDGFYRIDPTLLLTPQGSEQLIENRSEVTGQWLATAGHNTWFNYEIIYNVVNGNSYLLKYGSWADTGSSSDDPDPADFIPVHKGALKRWAGKRAQALFVATQIHGATLNDRLYVGFSDGTLEWTPLPRNGPDPRNDPECQFCDGPGEVYLPLEHDGFQADNKVYRGFSVFGPFLDGDNYAEVYYRTSRDAAWSPHQQMNYDGTPTTALFTASAQRANFIAASGLVSKTIETRVLLKKGAGSTINETPVVDTFAVHHQVRPEFALEYHMTFQCSNRVAKHNGTTERRRAEQLRQVVMNAVASHGPIPTRLPTGEEVQITYIEYEEHLRNVRNRNGHEWDIQVVGIGLETATPSTTIGTLTHGALESFTHGQIEVLL